jgi:hypothetical protein
MTTTTTTTELEAMRHLIEALQQQMEAQAKLLFATQHEVAHLKKLAWQNGWVR